MQDAEKTRGGFNVAGTVLGALVLVYFLFPVAYALPIRLMYGRAILDGPTFYVAFWPIFYLCDHVESYNHMISWESKMTRLDDP